MWVVCYSNEPLKFRVEVTGMLHSSVILTRRIFRQRTITLLQWQG